MALARCVIRLKNASGLPKDDVVNVFHFDFPASPLTGGIATTMWDNVLPFYRDTPPGAGSPLRLLLSPVLTGELSATFYDMETPTPRVPITGFSDVLTLAVGQAALPNEIACCLSYKAAPMAGIPPARRRGRIYVGPLNVDAQSYLGGVSRPDPDLVDILTKAAGKLEDDAAADLLPWVVYSPTIDPTPPIDGAAYPTVESGWVDNEWDIQRRREAGATVRTLWS